MKLSKFLTTIALTVTLSISLELGELHPKKSSAEPNIQPIAIIVNGQGDCCSDKMERVINELESINAKIIVAPWNSLRGGSEGNSSLDDARFLREVADYVNNNVEPNQPVILIGHSFGGDSVLKVAPRINRRILFLGILDPVAALGRRSPITGYGVPSNVDYFFNRWQTNVPWPIDLGDGTVQNCSARVCDQQEQSFAKNADGSEIRRACRAHEFCRNRSGGAVKQSIDFLGDVIKDDYGTAAKRLLHEPFPTDAYIQQQIADKIRTLVANYQPDIPSDISVSLGDEKVINYFRSNGTGILARQNSGQIIQRYSGWHKSWNEIVAIRADMLLFYDREAGIGEIYRIEPQGNLTFLYRYEGWRKTWSNISSLGNSRVRFVDDHNHS